MIIRFVRGKSWESRAIAWQEKVAMPFTPSHVEALTPDGKWYIGAHIDGGVEERAVGYDKDDMTQELLLPLTATPEQNAAFFRFLGAHIGEPYDWKAIIGFLLPEHEHLANHAICSALITLALRNCQWFKWPLAAPAHLIDPRDLLLIISSHMQIPGV